MRGLYFSVITGKRTFTSSDSGLSDEEGSSGEEQRRMPVKKIFSNQQALRKKIDDLNGMLRTMEQQKAELQTVLRIIEDWSEDLRSVDRTNLGVPYIRAVKQTLGKIYPMNKLFKHFPFPGGRRLLTLISHYLSLKRILNPFPRDDYCRAVLRLHTYNRPISYSWY